MPDKTAAKIAKLQALADHPNTPPHEAEAARNRILALQESKVTKPTPKATAEELRRLADEVSRAAGAFVDFDAAIRRDPRTTAQRNQDMQDRLKGKPSRPPRCKTPENFFDSGGNPRPRNKWKMTCQACGCELAPGEGAIMRVGDVWKAWCCESKPGPRRKKF